MRAANIKGQRFGRLTAIAKSGSIILPNGKKNGAVWLCLCDCGNTVNVPYNSLKNGLTRSCGCINRERLKKLHDKG